MARSLDSLIEYLLGEIALSGQQGCTPSQVLGYINQFYATTDRNGVGAANQDGQEGSQKPTIDRPLQERVWKWLTQHPDISVGEWRRGQNFSLAELETDDNAAIAMGNQPPREPSTVQVTPPKTGGSSLFANGNDQSTEIDVVRPSENGKDAALRLLVSEERMYLAICGHVRDVNRIFDTEFALLSIIASHRETGILQGDLVRQSGQDKRTVPKRTDRLHEKGYIDKRAVQAKGYRTSRLILTKFATTAEQNIIVQKKSEATPDESHAPSNDESIDFQVLINRMFDVLAKKPLITRTDLKRSLGMNSLWRSRVLSRLIREFEAIGCLKRVRANSKESHFANVQWHYDCVKFLRAPAEADLQAYFRADSSVNTISVAPSPDPDDNCGGVGQQVGDASILELSELEEVERIIPQWNPDRLMPNLLLDIVDSAGTSGASNEDIRNNSLGSFMERPLENAVARLSKRWTISQPAHLKHLAIVRDTAMTGTVAHYIHYSYPNFSELVEKGQAFWEAVGVAEKPSKSKKLNSDVMIEPVKYDRFTFPEHQHPVLQYKNGQCTLSEALKAGKPGTFEFTNVSATHLRDNPEEAFVPGAIRKAAAHKKGASQSQISNLVSIVSGTPQRPKSQVIGRPRKFVRGTEQFWQIQFKIVHGVKKKQAGVMSNPAGLAMFARRPADFDSVLVQALRNDLPVPEKPENITPDWMARVCLILDRESEGIYITPVGHKVRKGRITLFRSQTIIFRYGKLRNPGFFNPISVPPVRFIVSSAAHIFAHYNYRSWISSWASVSESHSKSPTVSTTGHVRPSSQLVQQGPKAGIFDDQLPAGHLHPPSLHVLSQASVEEEIISKAAPEMNMSHASHSQIIDPGPTFQSKTQPTILVPYVSHSGADSTNPVLKSRPSMKLYDLPPPLTTRAASRRQSKQMSSNSEPLQQPVPTQHPLSRSPRKRKERPFAAEPAVSQARTSLAVNPAGSDTDKDRQPLKSPIVPQQVNAGQDTFPQVNSMLNSVPVLIASKETKERSALITSSAFGHSLEGTGAPNPFPEAHTPMEAPNLEITKSLGHDIAEGHDVDQQILEAQQIIDELSGRAEGGARSVPGLRPEWNSEGYESVAEPSYDIPSIAQLDPDSDRPQIKKSSRNGVSGGSVGFLRRKIMLDLVERSGGAVPSNTHALWNAFAGYWQRAGYPGKPDNRTIAAAMKSLCDNGKLKKMKFAHKDKNGLIITKEILASPDLSPTDPIIRELQKNMIASHPMLYISPGMTPDPSIPKYARRVDYGRLQQQHMTEVIDTFVESEDVAAAFTFLEARQAAAAVREQRRRNRGKAVIRLESTNRPLTSNQAGRSGAYQRPEFSFINYSTRPTSVARPVAITEDVSAVGVENSHRALTFDAHIAGQSPAPHGKSLTSTESTVPHIPHLRADGNPLFSLPQVNASQIIWKPSTGYLQFPNSLGDIVSRLPGRRKNHARQSDSRWSQFVFEVESVAKWEERSFHYFQVTAPNWTFINHTLGNHDEALPLDGVQLTWTSLTKFDVAGKEHLEPLEAQPTAPHNLTNEPVQEASDDTEYLPDTCTDSRKRKRSGKRAGSYKKQKRNIPPTQADSNGDHFNVPSHDDIPSRKPRGQQHLRNMTEAAIYRLTVAIVLVRTLAGGLEKAIDWSIVMSLFPNDDLQYIRDRWRTLRNKFRKDIAGLTENLQEQFCAAYLRDEVPGLNFENLAATNWDGILAWALETLSRPQPQGIEDLPVSRMELIGEKDFAFDERRGWREFLGYNVAATVPMRETAAATIPFASRTMAPSATRQSKPSLHTPRLSTPKSILAQSYVLSTILTPQHTFRPQAAFDRLSSLAPTVEASNALLDSAIKSLGSSKAISRSRELAPAGLSTADAHPRLHAASKLFRETLSQRRPINRTILMLAAEYKLNVLDREFASTLNSPPAPSQLPFDPNATDGAMTAILQLYAYRRLRIAAGSDVPRSRYGWGYQTRKLEKAALRFTVLLEPSVAPAPEGTYVHGNPLAKRTFPPIPGRTSNSTALIPIWMTIHGSLNAEMWELMVASVLGIIAQRPGVGTLEITKTLRPAVQGTWEVNEVLWWLETGAIVKRTRAGAGEDECGWEVKEWWWMVLADTTFDRRDKVGRS